MSFATLLRESQERTDSLLCVGLDTDPRKLPATLANTVDPVVAFNRAIIEATRDSVCAYKINLAFCEAAGAHAWGIVHRTLEAIPAGIITIGDAKRGDIGNSSALYARAMMEDYRFTATTVSPYMGEDSVAPFLQNPEQGAFILAVTSNPGAKDFQYLRVNRRPLYEHVIARVKKWNGKDNCGIVVGATRPAELKRIRAIVPAMPILIPGVGAQGGDLRSAIRYGCDRTGRMAVINASRSILYASTGADFAEAAGREAASLRDQINALRKEFFSKKPRATK